MGVASDLIPHAFRSRDDLSSLAAADGDPDITPVGLGPGGLAIIFCTFASIAIFFNLVSYCLVHVVGTLTIVEEYPQPGETEGVNEPLLVDDAAAASEAVDASSAPVTAGIQRTLRYLRAHAGVFSAVRGWWYFFLWKSLEAILSGVLVAVLRPLLWVAADLLVPIVIALALWWFSNAWLHKVISKPSGKSWFRRVKEQRYTPSVLQAIALQSSCLSVTAFGVQKLSLLALVDNLTTVDGRVRLTDGASATAIAWEFLGIDALAALLQLALVLPSTVILVRVQASVLPDDDEGIVRLDAAFGRTALPADPTHPKGNLSLLEAWRSFTRRALLRLARMYVIYFGLNLLAGVLMLAILAAVFPLADSST